MPDIAATFGGNHPEIESTTGSLSVKISNPVTRSTMLFAVFAVILLHIFWSWVFARYVHADAQYRTLRPEYYDVQVVTNAEYLQLADRTVPKVTLSNGSTMEKSLAWYDVVLPGYKPAPDGEHYVLVTTYGTAHVLSYLDPLLILLGCFSACGVAISLWNMTLLQKEMTQSSVLVPVTVTRD